MKPAILLLGDLLRAHSTFLLHHASSMSALFVRTRRSKFIGLLGRYWDTFLSTWNVLMHGNPANSLYGGIKLAACGELGVGVGEEERGSGEREVLEGLVERIEGLVDVIVSKFGDSEPIDETGNDSKKHIRARRPTGPWLGSGKEPAADDGVIFLGTGALSRKSLRDVSHWVEDLYRWGPYAYGVMDNPSSNRRTKKSRQKQPDKKRELSPDAKKNSRKVYGLSFRDKAPRQSSHKGRDSMTNIDPTPIPEAGDDSENPKSSKRRPSFHRKPSSFTSTDSESQKGSKFVHYMKLGYGTHWSLGGVSSTVESHQSQKIDGKLGESGDTSKREQLGGGTAFGTSQFARNYSVGHYLIGLMGDIEDENDESFGIDGEDTESQTQTEDYNVRLLLRTLTVETEREEDARAEVDISIDLGRSDKKQSSSKQTGSEHTGTSNTSFESQDRNKTKKLRVIVYVNKPFVFVFLFELRTDALALTSLYRSLHHQIGPLLKPLSSSTTFRASKLDTNVIGGSTTPIYDLVWDPKLLTINSTIPNIPDPLSGQAESPGHFPWSRIEALNTHGQIINTYIASSLDRSEMERTSKTSRGWWVVWTRVPDSEANAAPLSSGKVNSPMLIAEDIAESRTSPRPGLSTGASRGTSTFGTGTSMASGPAHPFLEPASNEYDQYPKEKEIFLIRRASDYVATKPLSRFASGSVAGPDESWTSGPGKLAQGIGVDTKRYIEALLNLNR